MDLQTILDAARAIGPIIGKLPQVMAVIDHAVDALGEGDQATAKANLATLRQGNDDLHARLQEKLREAGDR